MSAGSDPRVAAIIAQFRTFHRQSRRDVCHGIMNELQSHEWREVKARASEALQADILANVPVEVAALIAGRLDVVDVFRLQRVSRRWQQVLSSIPVYMTVIRATMGQVALDSINHDVNNDFQHTLLSLIQKKLRIQSGWPKGESVIEWPLRWPRGYDSEKRIWGYSDGILARIKLDPSYVSLCGSQYRQETRLTTGNRETLLELRISTFLVAAVSTRYCHVWNLQNHELRSFRIPSQNIGHFVANGMNVVLSCGRTVIHWNLAEAVPRTVTVATDIVLLAVHPSKSQFTLVRLGESDLEVEDEMTSSPSGSLTSIHDERSLVIERFALNDANTFHPDLVHEQSLNGIFVIDAPLSYREIHRGQSTWLMACAGYQVSAYDSVFLSLNPTDGRVTVNFLPRVDMEERTISCVNHGVLYAARGPELEGLVILTCTIAEPVCQWNLHKVIRDFQAVRPDLRVK